MAEEGVPLEDTDSEKLQLNIKTTRRKVAVEIAGDATVRQVRGGSGATSLSLAHPTWHIIRTTVRTLVSTRLRYNGLRGQGYMREQLDIIF